MPKSFQFRAGAVIYFKGDPADRVFILQNGMVNLIYQDMESGKDIHDMVQQGEFFGVKSALGHYGREENAVALKDSTIMAFSVPEFEAFAMANIRIVMKMLTVFSTQLRRVHRQLAMLLKTEEQNPEAGLFSVGEYYLKQKHFGHAKYVFSRYLTYYPGGKNTAAAEANLELAERSLAGGGGAAAAAPEEGGDSQAYRRALDLASREQYQQAYLIFKQIADANPESEWAVKSVLEIGRCFYTLGKFAECIQFFSRALGKYPRHPDLREIVFFIGRSNERLGKGEQARIFYRKVLSMPAEKEDGIAVKVKEALEGLGA
ncbi:MAG: cyclic nucleotide-binding domain-containing protein [Treponema sp.]|jgi:CRP-like cAMP-binding protein|nr:cyclic nucleotide-binding domain-containing protein [Treponema sp.]